MQVAEQAAGHVGDGDEAVVVAGVDHSHIGQRRVLRRARSIVAVARSGPTLRRGEAMHRDAGSRADTLGAHRDRHRAGDIGEQQRDAGVHRAGRAAEIVGDVDLDDRVGVAVDEPVGELVEVGVAEAGLKSVHLGQSCAGTVPAGSEWPMLDHLSIQCADVAASAAFYDAVLAPLGGQRLMDFGQVIGYGVAPQARLLARPAVDR